MTPAQPQEAQQAQQAFNRLKRCRYGWMAYNYHDQYVGRSLDLYGQYSEEEVSIFRHYLQPGCLVVEAGSNIGAHTVPLARIVGPTGAVVAIEPQRLPFQLLCANIALNSLANVFAYHAAAAEVRGSIVVPLLDPNVDQNFANLSLMGYTSGEEVPLLTIDSLPLRACHLIKVDVEGMEFEVLQGAVQTIKRFNPVLYVENERSDREARLIRYIDFLGYSMFWHQPRLFNADNFFMNGENIFDAVVSRNMLCTRSPASELTERLHRVRVPAAAPVGGAN